MSDAVFKSGFAKDIKDYVDFKCSLGYSSSTYVNAMRRFDAFLCNCYPQSTVISEEIVNRWFEKKPSENTNGHIRRMITLKGFLSFLKTRNPDTYTIPDGIIGQYKPFLPYLYRDDELDSFFLSADTLPVHPIAKNREIICPVIFRMLYCCGLRPQEPLRLKCCDVNLTDGTLYIADSKVHKDRVVAMSEDLRNLCVKYNDVMEQRIPNRIYFFQRPDGRQYDALWLQRTFHLCLKNSDLVFTRKPPRVYDWRHNFATRIIQIWLREGLDIAVMLPRLSTYMGHTSLEDTAYYIHLVPEHFETNHMNVWNGIPEVPLYED